MTEIISVIIIDDDPDTINLLDIYLKDYPKINVSGKFTNPVKALEWLKDNPDSVDAVFLDFIMPEMHGLEVAEIILSYNQQIKIVFVTAHDDFAVHAFELNSLDYLLKPFTKERLRKSVERLIDNYPDKKIKKSFSQRVYLQFFSDFNVFIIEDSLKKPVDWSTQKTKETFAFLAHFYQRWVTREEIINAIWPDNDYEKSRVNMYSRIYNIKKLFLEEDITEVIQSSKKGYKLKFPKDVSCETDLDLFEKIIKKEQEVNNDNINLYEKVLPLLTGSYMEKNYYSWSSEKQQYFNIETVKLLQKMSDFYYDTGNIAKHEEVFKATVKLSPELEWPYHVLIKLNLKLGKRVEAMKVYRMLEKNLKDELGLDPDEKTRELLREITEKD